MIFLLNFVFSWYVLELWWQLGFPLKTSWSYEPTRPWPTNISDDIRMRAFAAVIIPIVSSVIIPLGVIMIIISLFKVDLGACRKILVAIVRQMTRDISRNLCSTPRFIAVPIS